MLIHGTRHVAIDLGDWVVDPASLSLLGEVRLRPALGAVRHPLVRPLGDDRGVRQQVHAPRARVQPLLRALRDLRAGDGGDVAGRARSRRCSPAGSWSGCRRRCWWRSSRSGPPRRGTGSGSGSSTGSRTPRCCWPRWRCTTSGARATSTSSWATGRLARRARRRDRAAGAAWSACCCWWPRRGSRPWCRSRAGCRGRWKGRPPRAPCSTGPCRSTWGRSCCSGSARSWSGRRCSAAVIVALGLTHGAVRVPGRQRADGHQVGAVVRLALAGRDHRGRDRPGLPLRGPGPPPRPRLPPDAPVRAGAEPAARLPHAGERHRRAPARRPAPAWGRLAPSRVPRLALPPGPGARLPRRAA